VEVRLVEVARRPRSGDLIDAARVRTRSSVACIDARTGACAEVALQDARGARGGERDDAERPRAGPTMFFPAAGVCAPVAP
jgi:hypothetical protein